MTFFSILRRAATLLLFLLPAAASLHAQEGFDTTLNFGQIRALLQKGNDLHDNRTQALALYHWALYSDRTYGRIDSSFQYLSKSIDLFKLSNDTLAYHRARLQLALWLSQRNMADQGLPMQLEALKYFERHNELRFLTTTLLQISRNYMIRGEEQNALKYRRLFREKNQILRDTLLELTVLMEEVARLQNQRRFREAVNLSLRTLDLSKRSNNPDYAAQSQYNLGLLSAQDEDYPAALNHLLEADRIYTGRNNTLQRRHIYQHLAEVYEKLDSLSKAYSYAMRYAALTDSVTALDRTIAQQRSALRYDSRAKEAIIKELKNQKDEADIIVQQQNLAVSSLAVALAAVILAMFFIVRDYRHRLRTSRVIAFQREELNQQKIRELENSLRIETMQSMLEGQELERRRIAHDLHDSLGGLLSTAKLALENLPAKIPQLANDPDLQKVRGLLDDTVDEARQIARNLQPVSLERFGLVRAVQDLVNRVSGENAPAITFQHFGESEQLAQPVALNCYRIVQELLQNSLKHAKPSEILVQINQMPGELALLVEDDGVGYDPEIAHKGMGSGNIAQRVQFLKGEITVETSPGRGCSTHITIPLAHPEQR